jgi:hypothetical protein
VSTQAKLQELVVVEKYIVSPTIPERLQPENEHPLQKVRQLFQRPDTFSNHVEDFSVEEDCRVYDQ